MIEFILRKFYKYIYFTKKPKCPVCSRGMFQTGWSEILLRKDFKNTFFCKKCLIFLEQLDEVAMY